MPRQYSVYILASRSRTLYVGVTNDLARRLEEHRSGKSIFTRSYRIERLVYVESTTDLTCARRRERQLKALNRRKKIQLITAMNPAWDDLSPPLCPERSEGSAPSRP